MSIEEQETIILLNEADLAEGYFQFGTSLQRRFDRLCKQVKGRENLISIKEDKETDGTIRWWQCKVPVAYLNTRSFSIKKPTPLSQARVEALSRARACSHRGETT